MSEAAAYIRAIESARGVVHSLVVAVTDESLVWCATLW